LAHQTAAAAQFAPPGRVLEVREYGRGNVHDTFLVRTDSPSEPHFILQRLNTRVFPRPQLIMGNLRTVSDHVRRRLEDTPLTPGRRWEISKVLLTPDGGDHFLDSQGAFWRALSFIAGARTLDTIRDLEQAREVGYALGMFHRLLSDLPPERLAVTLPGFHVTPGYLRHFDEILVKTGWVGGVGAQRAVPQKRVREGRPLPDGAPAQKSPEAGYCLKMIKVRRAWATVLEEARAQGKLPLRAIHGDPKVDNVMLDTLTGQAVALIDLDTVQPGLVHYDLGDCLRSGGNPPGEETERWETVRFEPELCRAILTGYLPRARDFLTPADYDYLYDAVHLLAFELGLRFFTDYLAGNVYFKARHRDHNLARALVQFRLTESIEAQETEIRAIIRELGG